MPIITQQELIDAQVDAQTLETVLNGSATPGTLNSRLGTPLKTIAKIIADLAAIDIGGSAAALINARIDDLETDIDLRIDTVEAKAVDDFAILAKSLLYGGINGTNGVLSLPQCSLTKSMYLIAEGDTLTKGQAASANFALTQGFCYPDLYAATDPGGLLGYSNLSVQSSTLTSMIARGSAVDAAITANPSYATYALSIFIGVNDGVFPGVTSAYSDQVTDWKTQLQTYINARKAAGITKVAIITLPPFNKELQAVDAAIRTANNAVIRGLVGTGHVDVVIEIGNDPILGNPLSNNPSANFNGPGSLYFNDWINFSTFGHYRAAMIASPKYNSLAVADEPVGSVAYPTFSVAPGKYPTTQSVALACATAGSTIRYTTNGTTPTAGSTLYSTPISVATSLTLRARAFKAGLVDSIPTKAKYVIG